MFDLQSKFQPTGDQPKAIEYLVDGIKKGEKFQTLLGVTGSGKTFTMANVIQKVNKPTLVLAHNKTLAGQLYSEFKEFFPNDHVSYFVSFYDYYQPEAYVPQSDTYIEKDASINDEIDKLRMESTANVVTYPNTIIVASVSCLYGLGNPEDWMNKILSLTQGEEIERNAMLKTLIEMQYTRNEIDFKRGTFRAKGDVVEIFPSDESEIALKVYFWGDEIEKIEEINPLTGKKIADVKKYIIIPNTQYATSSEKMERAIGSIEEELKEQVKKFKEQGKLIEAQRIEERTNFDLEMMRETGYCQGIENYSRHIDGRKPGQPPYTLFDYFPDDFLLLIDESHATLPQVRAMYNGDHQRKETLINYGFRLPSAFDNRPLKFEEFEKKINQCIFFSATPADYEKEHSKDRIVEQIIRPTGLLDPKIEVKPVENQVDDLIAQIHEIVSKNERVLVTTLTIRMAEELTAYLKGVGIKVAYLHTEVKTLERLKIIKELRQGKYDVLVGINLLREGIDLPEVSMIAIMDADKQGFLRSYRSLIQIIGRCARNAEGKVIMYADTISEAMDQSIKETNRRREIQDKYNKEHGIVPKTVIKKIKDVVTNEEMEKLEDKKLTKQDKEQILAVMEEEMKQAAANLDFEKAAELRDLIFEMKSE
jgi:excinuclease ABC subunit B